MATLFERAPALQRLAAKAQELTRDQNFTIVMPKNSSKGGLQAPPLDLIRNPFEDIADVDDDEMRAELNAPRKRTYADALTGKGTRTGPCQGPKGRVRKSKRAKKRAAAKAPLKVAGNCPASVKCKKVTDGNKKAPSEAHSAPTDGDEAQDSPVIGANAKSEPAPRSSRRSSWGSAVSGGSLVRGLSTALVAAARDGGANLEGGSGMEGKAVASKCGVKAEDAGAAEGDGGGSGSVECKPKGQINGAKQTAAGRRKKGRKRAPKAPSCTAKCAGGAKRKATARTARTATKEVAATCADKIEGPAFDLELLRLVRVTCRLAGGMRATGPKCRPSKEKPCGACTAPKHPAARKVSHVGLIAKFKSDKTLATAEAEAEAAARARDARSQGAGAATVDGESQADLDACSGAAREERAASFQVAGVQQQDTKGRKEGGFLVHAVQPLDTAQRDGGAESLAGASGPKVPVAVPVGARMCSADVAVLVADAFSDGLEFAALQEQLRQEKAMARLREAEAAAEKEREGRIAAETLLRRRRRTNDVLAMEIEALQEQLRRAETDAASYEARAAAAEDAWAQQTARADAAGVLAADQAVRAAAAEAREAHQAARAAAAESAAVAARCEAAARLERQRGEVASSHAAAEKAAGEVRGLRTRVAYLTGQLERRPGKVAPLVPGRSLPAAPCKLVGQLRGQLAAAEERLAEQEAAAAAARAGQQQAEAERLQHAAQLERARLGARRFEERVAAMEGCLVTVRERVVQLQQAEALARQGQREAEEGMRAADARAAAAEGAAASAEAAAAESRAAAEAAAVRAADQVAAAQKEAEHERAAKVAAEQAQAAAEAALAQELSRGEQQQQAHTADLQRVGQQAAAFVVAAAATASEAAARLQQMQQQVAAEQAERRVAAEAMAVSLAAAEDESRRQRRECGRLQQQLERERAERRSAEAAAVVVLEAARSEAARLQEQLAAIRAHQRASQEPSGDSASATNSDSIPQPATPAPAPGAGAARLLRHSSSSASSGSSRAGSFILRRLQVDDASPVRTPQRLQSLGMLASSEGAVSDDGLRVAGSDPARGGGRRCMWTRAAAAAAAASAGVVAAAAAGGLLGSRFGGGCLRRGHRCS